MRNVGHQATVHDEFGAGGERGLVTGQEEHCLRHIVGADFQSQQAALAVVLFDFAGRNTVGLCALLADLIIGRDTGIDAAPYAPDRGVSVGAE